MYIWYDRYTICNSVPLSLSLCTSLHTISYTCISYTSMGFSGCHLAVPKLTHFLGEIRCQNGTQQLVVELPPEKSEKYAKVNSDIFRPSFHFWHGNEKWFKDVQSTNQTRIVLSNSCDKNGKILVSLACHQPVLPAFPRRMSSRHSLCLGRSAPRGKKVDPVAARNPVRPKHEEPWENQWG